MYEDFFKFNCKPFAVLPDSECVFWTDGHLEAFSVIELGLDRLSPVTVLTGGIGTGKTTLIRHLLHIAPPKLTLGLLSNCAGDRENLLPWVLTAFGQESSPASNATLMGRLERHFTDQLDRGRRCVLVVDEAQDLCADDLENLRLLSNLNTAETLVMVVLVGQPQLRAKLTQAGNRRICQRIGADYHLEPLMADETGRYVRHRIVRAGGSEDLFDRAALDEVHRITAGVPRKIDVLCDLALMSAFADTSRRVGLGAVRSVMEDARRHGTYTSLTEREILPADGAATDAEIDPITATAVDGPTCDPLQLTLLLEGGGRAGEQPTGPAPLDQTVEPAKALSEHDDIAAELFGFASSPDDIWDFIDNPDDEASMPSVPAVAAGTRDRRTPKTLPPMAERPPAAAIKWQPLYRRTENGAGGGPARRAQTEVADAAAVFAKVGKPQASPFAAATTADQTASPSSGEAALRRAFGPRTGWRRGWRSAAGVTALAASGSIAAAVAVALLPNSDSALGEPSEISELWMQADETPPALRSVDETLHPPRGLSTPSPIARPGGSADGAAYRQLSDSSRSAEAPAAPRRSAPSVDRLGRPSFEGIHLTAAPTTKAALAGLESASMSKVAPGADSVRLSLSAHPASPSSIPPGTAMASPRPTHARDGTGPVAPTHGVLSMKGAAPVPTEADAHRAPLAEGAMLEAAIATAKPDGRTATPPESSPAARPPLRPGDLLRTGGPSAGSDEDRRPASIPNGDAQRAAAGHSSAHPADAAAAEAAFLHALDVAMEDPQAAAVAYARAALMGHERAAYYLGQIYETGDGVPVDFAIARHWYDVASRGNRHAQRQLPELPRPESGELSPPLPLLAAPVGNGHADFVWTSGPGADPLSYVLEISAEPSAGPAIAYPVVGSAARLPLGAHASHWRVLALEPGGGRPAVSDWHPISPDGGDRATLQARAVAPAASDSGSSH